jgi:hypothetical protein
MSAAGVVLSLQQITRMWRVINSTDLGGITSDNLVSSMGSKNAAVDVFTMGFVMTLPFAKNGEESSLSFLVCTAEFVLVRHTDKGELQNVLTSLLAAVNT